MIHVILICIIFLFVEQKLDNFQLFIRLQNFLIHLGMFYTSNFGRVEYN